MSVVAGGHAHVARGPSAEEFVGIPYGIYAAGWRGSKWRWPRVPILTVVPSKECLKATAH